MLSREPALSDVRPEEVADAFEGLTGVLSAGRKFDESSCSLITISVPTRLPC